MLCGGFITFACLHYPLHAALADPILLSNITELHAGLSRREHFAYDVFAQPINNPPGHASQLGADTRP